MENKNYKGLIWLVVILIILVVALMGFIVYREFYSENKTNVDNSTNTTTNIEENNENIIKNINDFPKENSSNLKLHSLYDYVPNYPELKENMNSTFKLDGIEFSYDTKRGEYDEESGEYFIDLYVRINGIEIVNLDYRNDNPEILITDDYIIIQDGEAEAYDGPLNIYEKNGNLVKTVVNTTKEAINKGTDCDNADYINTTMKFVDDKLYYAERQTNSSGVTSILVKYIDLNNNFKEYVIQEYQLLCDQD